MTREIYVSDIVIMFVNTGTAVTHYVLGNPSAMWGFFAAALWHLMYLIEAREWLE